MSNLKEMQNLLDKAKGYRANLSKPALENSFIKDLKFNDARSEMAINEKDNIYVK